MRGHMWLNKVASVLGPLLAGRVGTTSDAIWKKHLCLKKKHVFFCIKNLASKKKKHSKSFFFFFSKYSFKRNYKITVA